MNPASPSSKPKVLKLETGKPQTIALRYPTPKKVSGFSGPQLLWMLVDGLVLYTPEYVGPAIAKLELNVGERFTIQKQQNGQRIEYLVSKGSPAAKLVEQAESLEQPGVTPITQTDRKPPQIQTQLAMALKTAVSAAAEAEKHAQGIGYTCRFSPADIRAMAISVLISWQNRNAA